MHVPARSARQDDRPAVRRAVWADVEALVALRRSMYAAMDVAVEALDDPTWQAAYRAWLGKHIDDPGTYIAVATVEADAGEAGQADDAGERGTLDDARSDGEVHEVVVACAIGEVTAIIPGPEFATGRVGLLSNVSTFEKFRHRGLGATCTDVVLTWLTETMQVERVDLFATDQGEAIYERRGFARRPFPAMVRRGEH